MSSNYARFVDVAGVRTYYRATGDGQQLLLLPSMLVLGRTYQPLTTRLAQHFRVIVPDMPGSGLSSTLAVPWSFKQYAAWGTQFLDVLDTGRVVVVGHSNSGAVAIALATLHPERVSKLVLADTIGARKSNRLSTLMLGRTIDASLEMRLNARAWPHVLHNICRHPRTFRHQVKAAGEADLLDLAGQIAMPTLLAWGRRDHTVPIECAGRLRARIADSRLHLNNGSHDWLITHPDDFTRAVIRFTGD